MFNDVKREVIEPAKTPDGQQKQQDGFPGLIVEDQQDRGRNSQHQKQQAFHLDPRWIRDVFHWNKLKMAVAARLLAPGSPKAETIAASHILIWVRRGSFCSRSNAAPAMFPGVAAPWTNSGKICSFASKFGIVSDFTVTMRLATW